MAEHGAQMGPRPAGDARFTEQNASVAELVKRLSEQSSALARKEVELAKLEMTEKARRTGIGAGMLGGAGLLGMFAFGALTAGLILALNLAVAGWAATLIVAGAYALIAGGLAMTGKSNVEKGTPPAPQQAVESTKEDVTWVKDRAKSAKV